MTTIAIDSCLGAASFSVRGPDGFQTTVVYDPDTRISEGLLVDVKDALVRASAPLTKIIATIGPGTFTGQRLGIATAQGLAAASPDAQCFALTSLQAMVLSVLVGPKSANASVEAESPAPIWVVADARGGFAYTQAFDEAGRALEDCRLEPLAEVRAGRLGGVPLPDTSVIICASPTLEGTLGVAGLRDVRTVDDRRFDLTTFGSGTAAKLLDVPGRLHLRPVERFRPLYLKPPDAKPARSEGLRER